MFPNIEIIPKLFIYSMTCLAALHRHGECLALVNKRLETEIGNPDLFIMRARLHEMFRNVGPSFVHSSLYYKSLICP